MNSSFHTIIIGAGAMGSAAAYHLSKTNEKILVIDQYASPHAFGSSHGESRIIREAYFESPMYVPLVRQAYALWEELEKASGQQLFLKTGGLMLGHREDRVFHGAAQSATLHDVQYEFLEAAAIKNRFSAFKPEPETVALYEQNAGILFPEKCIEAHIHLAEKNGVTFHSGETVKRIEPASDSVMVYTDHNTYLAQKIIVSAGAWMSTLFPELKLPLEVKRQVLCWFSCTDQRSAIDFLPSNFPIFIWEHEKNKIFYGFPDLGNGVKMAIHHRGLLTTAATIDRTIHDGETDELSMLLHKYFEGQWVLKNASVCMYTNTPDEDFIIDYYPGYSNIIIASPCSGHGFKFSSAIGYILAAMVREERLPFDINPFSLKRFS